MLLPFSFLFFIIILPNISKLYPLFLQPQHLLFIIPTYTRIDLKRPNRERDTVCSLSAPLIFSVMAGWRAILHCPDSFCALLCWSLFTRFLLIALIILSNIILPDHQADEVLIFDFQGDEKVSNGWMSFTKWDAAYFLHIARHGYQFESAFAFFPLYPLCIRQLEQVISQLTSLSPDFSSIIAGVFISNCCFVCTLVVLWYLLQELHISKSIRLQALYLFCLNPANIFFASVYSESLYACLAFGGMLFWEKKWYITSLILFVLASGTRSNGMLNAVFIFTQVFIKQFMYMTAIVFENDLTYSMLLRQRNITREYVHSFVQGLIAGCCCCLCTFSYVLYCYVVHHHICGSSISISTNTITHWLTFLNQQVVHVCGVDLLSADLIQWTEKECTPVLQLHCDEKPFLSVYGAIQYHYWNVGFLRYYTWKQLPNFMLAAPIFVLCAWICHHYLLIYVTSVARLTADADANQKNMPKGNLIHKHFKNLHLFLCSYGHLVPYLVHMVAVAVVALCFAHIQISTRLLCSSCPLICCHICLILSEREEVDEEKRLRQRRKIRERQREGQTDAGPLRGHVDSADDRIFPAAAAAPSSSSAVLATRLTAMPNHKMKTTLERDMVTLYFLTFTVAGLVLHPNFFPWT